MGPAGGLNGGVVGRQRHQPAAIRRRYEGPITIVLGFQHTTAMHVSIAIGLVVAYVAALDLWLIHYGPKPIEH